MSVKDGRDYLLLIWKEPKTRRRYLVGELSKNGQFEFTYNNEVHEAIEDGFELLIAFPEINKLYKSDKLFPVFASRLPDPKRKGIEVILEKYGLEEYDAYKLLKRSGARLPIDNIEFIDPIINFESKKITRQFFLAGSRYYLGCEGANCNKSLNVKLDEELRLILEPENEHDKHAIKITNISGNLLGYLPRYYAQEISQLIGNDTVITCRVIEVSKDTECVECIKVDLTIEKNQL
ncbi:MAG: HIRAN domain-containing protein [Desulfosporosinus sp.]